MALDLARRMKDSVYCSLEKQLWMCSNFSFRYFGELILRAFREKKPYENTPFCFVTVV